ncbi:MAG: fatty acid desaturase family protein [Saprospiraceae bacterium]
MTTYDARDLKLQIDPIAFKTLFQIKPLLHAQAILFNWLVIGATIYGCLQYFNPATYVLAVLIIGARMHALAILMHDATHYRFLKNRKWNDLLTNITCMYPVFSSIEQYRDNHLRHHKHLNTEEDPDWVAKLGKREFHFPKTKLGFFITVISYFTLYQGIMDAVWFLKRFGKTDQHVAQKSGSQLPRLVFYLVLFTLLTVVGGWFYFLIFWIVPYLSTFFMFQYIRSVAEHYGELSYDHLLSSTRSVKPNLIERFFIAPHQVGFHLEHHLYPGVPFYNLPKLHELLMQEEEYQEKAHITKGYLSGLMNELGSVE